MANSPNIEAIIPQIYEASEHAELWRDIVLQLSDVFDGSCVGYVLQNLTDATESVNELARFDKELTELHFEEYDTPQKNPGVAALFRAPLCQPFSLRSFIDVRTYASDPSVQAILKPQKIDKGLFVAFERDAGCLGFINLFRRTDQSDFDAVDHKRITALSIHIARAAKLRRLITRQNDSQAVADDRGRHSGKIEGTVMLSANGRVLDADADARAIFKSQSTLVLRNDRLKSTSHNSNMNDETLQDYLADANAPRYPFVLSGQGRLLITLDVLPAQRLPSGLLCRPVVICRSFLHSAPNIKAFCSFYGLSKAECRVVEALTVSATATQAAAVIGISRDTIKSHLARIYSKTDCSSLSRLMFLLGRFSALGSG